MPWGTSAIVCLWYFLPQIVLRFSAIDHTYYTELDQNTKTQVSWTITSQNNNNMRQWSLHERSMKLLIGNLIDKHYEQEDHLYKRHLNIQYIKVRYQPTSKLLPILTIFIFLLLSLALVDLFKIFKVHLLCFIRCCVVFWNINVGFL